MQDGQVFLWALLITIVAFGLFFLISNVIAKALILVLAIGALYTTLIFWRGVDTVFAFGVVAIAVIIAGASMMFKKKGKQRQPGELWVGLFVLVLGLFSFLATLGALNSPNEGFWQTLNQAFRNGGELVKTLWDSTDQGIEQINQ